ncbi:MAG: hypothetical protein H6897_06095 [Rhodobacteraceae bacterium]|jgi:hypothetical protein|uniref:hypothetical protein n=1 Tax=Albidovulum sp. TaxID=1872424 RepID=UPI001D1C5280|nr:hypothetical protein [uncultured Defluviimonas sp.]MCB2125288.1 hypothetical protein [Paracoccaceae bacterium]MCC0069484.1 hypothetical protein [Paracoccaceae bacterium]
MYRLAIFLLAVILLFRAGIHEVAPLAETEPWRTRRAGPSQAYPERAAPDRGEMARASGQAGGWRGVGTQDGSMSGYVAAGLATSGD